MKINAVIENKDGGTLVLDFPRSIYDVYEKIQSVGIRKSPHQITLSDEEGNDVRVKLYSEDEVGKHLLLTLNEQNTLADANLLAFMVDNAKEDFRSKLEQKLLHNQYGSMQEVTDDIKKMLYESGPVKAVFYCPLVGEVTDDEGFSSPVDGRFLKSYLVTPGNEQIGVSPKNYTAEYNSEAMKQYEQVKKGNIAIIKHTDDGQTQIETPEEGAEFAVYLKSAGSYDNAKDSERDYLICDENGFAQTKDLPYGRYTVQQTKGWEGRELLKPFDVFVSENGETYRYLINNANFYSYVKVVKIDSTTGKTIPASGIGFHIYDPSGNQIQMTFTYPAVTTIDTFYTDGDGMLITPEKLEYGKGYSLVEVSAPYGYVLNSDPVYFDITEENSTEENAVTVVVVTKENAPQMGVITVERPVSISPPSLTPRTASAWFTRSAVWPVPSTP